MERPCVLFVSAAPQSVGHVYRVTNHAERLRDQGVRVVVVEPEAAVVAMAALPGLQAVVLFRPSPARDQLDQWRALCSQRKLRLLCDVDDLTFVPDLWIKAVGPIGTNCRRPTSSSGATALRLSVRPRWQAMGCW